MPNLLVLLKTRRISTQLAVSIFIKKNPTLSYSNMILFATEPVNCLGISSLSEVTFVYAAASFVYGTIK
uniref:Uncharacterized protein n=1 Tax=Pararge aegeria TaxID=116150 RepID=S4P4R2_9NEOP